MFMSRAGKVCIYTAIFGGYDDLKEQPEQTIDCDFVCFSDRSLPETHGWRVVRQQGIRNLHPRLQAKYYKLMHHRLFIPHFHQFPFFGNKLHDYTASIWIDASVKLRSPYFAEEMVASLGRYGMAMFIHPDRSCIYDEATLCCDFPKYCGLPLLEQVEHYRRKGYPEKNGLMAAGIIVRETGKRELSRVNQEWWKENLRWSYQDQLSLPYVLWKLRYGYDPINLNLWENHLFELIPHHSHL
jgi:hypothetical protein